MIEKDSGSIQKQLARSGSVLQKYRRATVGSKGLMFLVAYELIIAGTGSLPGNLGTRLRSIFYSMLFMQVGKNLIIGRNCSMKRPHLIEIENNVMLGDNVSLDVKRDGLGIRICDDVVVGPGTIFSCPGGRIILGKETKTGRCCRLGSLLGLTVGKGCTIGDYTYIVGAGHKFDSLDRPIIDQPLTCKGPNFIGDNVTIGDEVTVLDGVQIGENVHVASGSLVISDIAAGSRVSGVPARGGNLTGWA